jgi:hypothetical protein
VGRHRDQAAAERTGRVRDRRGGRADLGRAVRPHAPPGEPSGDLPEAAARRRELGLGREEHGRTVREGARAQAVDGGRRDDDLEELQLGAQRAGHGLGRSERLFGEGRPVERNEDPQPPVARPLRLAAGRHQQHRPVGVAQHLVGDAAEEPPPHAAAAVRRHNDQGGVDLARRPQDRRGGTGPEHPPVDR